MEIDLKIGWNDLSKDCQNKIKELHHKFGSKNVKIQYPAETDMKNYITTYFNNPANNTIGSGISINRSSDSRLYENTTTQATNSI